MKQPLTRLFKKFCNSYISQKSSFGRRLMWLLAEIIFPFRSGQDSQTPFLLIDIINIALDTSQEELRPMTTNDGTLWTL
jgi:hypothetical protein